MTLKGPLMYLGRVIHVMHLALEDQPITGWFWTDDRSVLCDEQRADLGGGVAGFARRRPHRQAGKRGSQRLEVVGIGQHVVGGEHVEGTSLAPRGRGPPSVVVHEAGGADDLNRTGWRFILSRLWRIVEGLRSPWQARI